MARGSVTAIKQDEQYAVDQVLVQDLAAVFNERADQGYVQHKLWREKQADGSYAYTILWKLEQFKDPNQQELAL